MLRLIEILNEQFNAVFFKTVTPEKHYEHYYELQITCELTRAVKVIKFYSVKELMDYVHEHHLMYEPLKKAAMVQFQSSGERHILQLNKIDNADTQTVTGLQNAN